MNSNKVIICAGVKSAELAEPLIQSLAGLHVNVVVGNNQPSFSKMVNEIFISAINIGDIVIFCSHRVRPTTNDVNRMVNLINQGYGFVTFRRMAFFGFKKELLNVVGFFDERFVPGGYEDDDYFLRLRESNIAIYEDMSVDYVPGLSLWAQELKEFEGLQYKQPITYEFFIKKWNIDHAKKEIYRCLPEISLAYKIKDNGALIKFKPFSESILLNVSILLGYTIKKIIELKDKHILIFGGTGSLGKKLIDMIHENNKITVFSRDENKHWMMQNDEKYKNIQINYLMGDIRDSLRVEEVIRRVDPHVIIIASAIKHIDKCEFEVNEGLMTNTNGVFNVCRSIEKLYTNRIRLESTIFISTDKACSPTNVYGMTKSLSERIMVEYSLKMKYSKLKFVNCRYGNVLDSRGSIIPKLKENKDSVFYLTHPDMTRFIMTQEQAVNLIKYSILCGNSGETIIPKLRSMNIMSLFKIFSEKNNKTIEISKIRPGEKIHEELLNSEELNRTSERDDFYIIHPSYMSSESVNERDPAINLKSYSSDDFKMSKDELYNYLSELDLL
jgi:UDP-N-acetylglucosamine 4,6-dehydratase